MHAVRLFRSLCGPFARNVHRIIRTSELPGEASFRRLFASKEVTKSSTDQLAKKDEPIVFSQSSAYKNWKAMYIIEYPDHRPKIQRPVAIISFVALFLYFFILREENDLDELIYQPLEKTVPQLELPILEATYESHLYSNRPTDEILKRINEAKARQQFRESLARKSPSNS